MTRTATLACSLFCLAACIVSVDPGLPNEGSKPSVPTTNGGSGGAPDSGPRCASSGGACQTAQDCCSGTCDPYFQCQPFPADVGGATCAPVTAACSSGSDCCSGQCNALGLCANGFPVHCLTDTDCPYSTTCQVCINSCVYPAFYPCDSKTSCACGFTCQGGTCASMVIDGGPGACVNDVDCPAGEQCNPLSQVCQYPMCLQPSGPSLPDGGVTAPVPCAFTAGVSDCPADYACVPYDGVNVCLRPCLTNPNCPAGQVCEDIGAGPAGSASVCAASCGTACATDADCPAEDNCEDGNCVRHSC